jgi:hypothetical protein
MTSLAIVPGAAVWLALAVATVGWLAVTALARDSFLGPRRVLRWFLGSWLPRLAVLACWAGAGWHIFCQRP